MNPESQQALKYTCWTVYTAIIAGLYVAKSSNEIGNGLFVVFAGETSIFFCFLLTRVQVNYKIYCHTAERIESILREDELKVRQIIDRESFRVGPFDVGASVLPGHFDKRTVFEKIFGSVPYFTLHISFFIGIFLTFAGAYLILPEDGGKSSITRQQPPMKSKGQPSATQQPRQMKSDSAATGSRDLGPTAAENR